MLCAYIPLGERPIGGDGDLGLVAGDGDALAKVASLAAGDLDALLQELLERGDLHDLVLHGLGAVDREGDGALLLAAAGGAALRPSRHAARHLLSSASLGSSACAAASVVAAPGATIGFLRMRRGDGLYISSRAERIGRPRLVDEVGLQFGPFGRHGPLLWPSRVPVQIWSSPCLAPKNEKNSSFRVSFFFFKKNPSSSSHHHKSCDFQLYPEQGG